MTATDFFQVNQADCHWPFSGESCWRLPLTFLRWIMLTTAIDHSQMNHADDCHWPFSGESCWWLPFSGKSCWWLSLVFFRWIMLTAFIRWIMLMTVFCFFRWIMLTAFIRWIMLMTDLSQVNHFDANRQPFWFPFKVLAALVLCPLMHRECPFAATTAPVGWLQAPDDSHQTASATNVCNLHSTSRMNTCNTKQAWKSCSFIHTWLSAKRCAWKEDTVGQKKKYEIK